MKMLYVILIRIRIGGYMVWMMLRDNWVVDFVIFSFDVIENGRLVKLDILIGYFVNGLVWNKLDIYMYC